MKNKKVNKLEQKKVSVKELKYWLRGILEFQDANWVPNKEQWNNILNKIFNLDELEIHENNFIKESTPSESPNQNFNRNISQSENVAPIGGVLGDIPKSFPQLSEQEIQQKIHDIKNDNGIINDFGTKSKHSVPQGKKFI